MPKVNTILSAATRSIIAMVERRAPAVHRREWAALAIEAARRGGLSEPDLAALRVHFRDQQQIDAEDAAKGG